MLNDGETSKIEMLDTADEFNCVIMGDKNLYTWGKNDRGQMGVGTGIGTDMIECENLPTLVDLKDENEDP